MSKDKQIALTQEQIDEATEAMWAAITRDDSRNIKIDIKALKAAIEAGANIYDYEVYEYTALHFAAENGKTKAIAALLEAKAYIHAVDCYGNTPLHIAAQYGKTKAITALLEAGADINAPDAFGETPLHHAAGSGKTRAIAELLVNGAAVSEDRLVFNDNGQRIETTEIERVQDLFLQAKRQLSLVKNENGLFYKQGLEHIPQAAKIVAANEAKSIIPNHFAKGLNLSAEYFIPATVSPSFVERLGIPETVQLSRVSTSHRDAISGFAALAKSLFTSGEGRKNTLSFAVMEKLLVPCAFRNLVLAQQEGQRKAQLEGKDETLRSSK